MGKLIVSERISIDGVFDAETMDQWSFPYATDDVIEVIRAGLMRCDVYLLGRTTYEMLGPGWSNTKNDKEGLADKLNSMQKVVVSSTLNKADWHPSTIIKDHVVEEITRLKAKPGQDILVHGSATLVQSLMQANLIDEYEFIVFPSIVGTGKRFFKEGMQVKGLELIGTKSLGKGVVVFNYQPAKSSQ